MKHPGKSCPTKGVVSESEKAILARKKITAKKALNKNDLDKVSDDELRLLPLKDFWDHGKKEWKKNVAGNFGKQNNEQWKRLFGKNKGYVHFCQKVGAAPWIRSLMTK